MYGEFSLFPYKAGLFLCFVFGAEAFHCSTHVAGLFSFVHFLKLKHFFVPQEWRKRVWDWGSALLEVRLERSFVSCGWQESYFVPYALVNRSVVPCG